jgi:hypothetical protein
MTTYRVLLPHPLESRLLMMHVHGEWRLPEWEEPTAHPWQVTDHVNRAVAARFGMETTVLRCVTSRTDMTSGQETRVYELENHSAPHDMVPAATWIGRAELPVLPILDPEARELIAEWYSRDAGELPARGPAWMRRGWYIEALAWVTARLSELGMTTGTTPEQLRSWERSFVMRIATDQRMCYFKAVPPIFAHEPGLVRWLARAYPDHFPDVLATDPARGWLLERAVGPDALPLEEVREEEEWYRAVRRLAEIQVDCSTRTRELSELGCPHRGLEILARRIPHLCADSGAFLLGEPCGLSRSEIARVAALAPTLLTLCEELASYEIPDSIEHGGFVASTVFSAFSGPVYVDWSNSSLSHPFFTVSRIMTEAVSLVPATSRESRRRLRDSYLAPWAELVPHQTLVRAFEIARVLAPVHQAATAHAELIPASGYRWEVQCAVPAALRTALQLLADSDSPVSIAV